MSVHMAPTQNTAPVKRPLLAAGIGVVVLVAIVVGLSRIGTRPNLSTSSATGAFIGSDIHSVFALTDGHVYVGGHDAVAATRDGGRSWSSVRGLARVDAVAWASTADTLYVAGHRGVRRSTDNGATFHALEGLPRGEIHGFGAGPEVLFVTGPAFGLAASRDGGRTWQSRSKSDGRTIVGRIIVDANNPDVLLASGAQSGPMRSTDGGRSWTTLLRRAALWVSSPDGGTTIYSSSEGGFVTRSTDAGTTWQPIQVPVGARFVEAAVPGDGHNLYAAGRTGDNARLWLSFDGGATWSEPSEPSGA